MVKLLALRQTQFELKNELRPLLAKVDAGTATAEEVARMRELGAELDKVSQEVDQALLDRERAKPIASVSFVNGVAVPTAVRRDSGGPTYAAMFPDARGDAGFQGFGEFAAALHSGLWHPAFQALTKSGDVGYMIPPEYAAQLLDDALEGEVVRPRARIEPMQSDTKIIAGLAHSDGTDAPFGISGNWTAEGAEIAPDDPNVRSVRLTAKKLAALVQISNEAAADGTAIDRQLSQALTRGLGWLLDSAFLTGVGGGQPTGVLNATCTITVGAEVGQVADTILYENLVKMFARLHPASIGNAVWVANSSAIPQLLSLSVPVGTGGSHIPVMTQVGGGFAILTRPVVFTEKLPALGNRGDILLADFSQYVVGLRQEVTLERSTQLGFSRDTVYYRCKLRADGLPLWDAAYTPKHGDTLSPFVTLAAR